MSASWYTALENIERHQEMTLHTPWVSSLNHDGVQQLYVPSTNPGKGPRPCFTPAHRWAGSACSRPIGAMKEEEQDGNWNLARLTRAFCPSLSGIPLSPISVRSPSFKSCKSYTDRKGEKEKDINCVLLPSYTFSISSSYKYLINVHTC